MGGIFWKYFELVCWSLRFFVELTLTCCVVLGFRRLQVGSREDWAIGEGEDRTL